jgi:hypothetical protein
MLGSLGGVLFYWKSLTLMPIRRVFVLCTVLSALAGLCSHISFLFSSLVCLVTLFLIRIFFFSSPSYCTQDCKCVAHAYMMGSVPCHVDVTQIVTALSSNGVLPYGS